MSEPLSVDADGLRRASARSDDLASELPSPTGAGSVGGSQPTAAAVQVIHGLIAGVRADQAAFLAGRSGLLTSSANGYENTDSGSAKKFGETM